MFDRCTGVGSSGLLLGVSAARFCDTRRRLVQSFERYASLHSKRECADREPIGASSLGKSDFYLLIFFEDIAAKGIVVVVTNDETEDFQIETVVRDVEDTEKRDGERSAIDRHLDCYR